MRCPRHYSAHLEQNAFLCTISVSDGLTRPGLHLRIRKSPNYVEFADLLEQDEDDGV